MDSPLILNVFAHGFEILLNGLPMEFEWILHAFSIDSQLVLKRFPMDFEKDSTGL